MEGRVELQEEKSGGKQTLGSWGERGREAEWEQEGAFIGRTESSGWTILISCQFSLVLAEPFGLG